jgi:hypothetical protein
VAAQALERRAQDRRSRDVARSNSRVGAQGEAHWEMDVGVPEQLEVVTEDLVELSARSLLVAGQRTRPHRHRAPGADVGSAEHAGREAVQPRRVIGPLEGEENAAALDDDLQLAAHITQRGPRRAELPFGRVILAAVQVPAAAQHRDLRGVPGGVEPRDELIHPGQQRLDARYVGLRVRDEHRHLQVAEQQVVPAAALGVLEASCDEGGERGDVGQRVLRSPRHAQSLDQQRECHRLFGAGQGGEPVHVAGQGGQLGRLGGVDEGECPSDREPEREDRIAVAERVERVTQQRWPGRVLLRHLDDETDVTAGVAERGARHGHRVTGSPRGVSGLPVGDPAAA